MESTIHIIDLDPDPPKKSKDMNECAPASSSEHAAKNVGRQDQNRQGKRKFDEMDARRTKSNVNVVNPIVQKKEPRNNCIKMLIDLTVDSEDEVVDEVLATKKVNRINSNIFKKSEGGACQGTDSSGIKKKSKSNNIDLSLYSNKKVNPSSSSISSKGHSMAKGTKEDKDAALDVDNSDSRTVSEIKNKNRKSISHRNMMVCKEKNLNINKKLDTDDDSNNASRRDLEKSYKQKYISQKRILKRINKIIDFDDDSDDDASVMKKTCKIISQKRILKRIHKIIDFSDGSDDDLNENICDKEKSVQIKNSQIVNEEDVFDVAKIRNSSKKTIELHIGHQECQDKIPDVELGDMDINVGDYADNLSYTLQPITEKNHSPCHRSPEKNLNDICSKDLLDKCDITDAICDNKDTEGKHERKNIEVEKITFIKISGEELSDIDVDVVGISDDSNNTSITDQNQFKEKNNSLSKNDFNEYFNSESSLNNSNNDLYQLKENTSVGLNDIENNVDKKSDSSACHGIDSSEIKEKSNNIVLDIDNNVDKNSDSGACQSIVDSSETEEKSKSNDISLYSNKKVNLNVSKSISMKKQVENKTTSPVAQNHCSVDGISSKAHTCNDSIKKQLNCLLSKTHSNDNILMDSVSKNENMKEISNACSARNIESPTMQNCKAVVLKVNTKQKNTDSKIKSPQVERPSILPTTTNSYGQKIFRFFWLDAYEDPYTDPGVVFLFGKILDQTAKQYISCCVKVNNVPRRIYVLPRKDEDGEQSALDKAYVELNEYMRQKSINECKCKKVQKIYAFEKKDVPQNTTYLEVRYSAAYPALDSDYSGPAIQEIFGTNVNAMELFLIEKKIKGPCWMDVRISPFASSNLSSWCKFEINCTRMEDISVTNQQQISSDIIPIAVAALSIQVSLDEKLQKYDIASVGIAIQEQFHLYKGSPRPLFSCSYCLVSQCSPWPKFVNRKFAKWKDFKVILCETETDLLEQLLELLQSLDPDILIGYDTDFEFDILVRKIMLLGTNDWSRIGKLRRSVPPKFKGKIYLNQVLCGRPICDIQTSMNEFQSRVINCDLSSLYSSALSKDVGAYKEIKPEECLQYYRSLYYMELLIKSTMTKAFHIFEISAEQNILPLAVQITRIVGNTLSRTLSCGIGERNEFYLLHAFQSKNYLTPDKRKDKCDMYDGNKKSSYTGGAILEPKTGFYDTPVLLLDYNSLYPSIIVEFNICFTTIPGAAHASVNELCRVESRAEQGILPAVISELVQSRLQIKKMINSPNLSSDLRRYYNSRQLALKLTANSMYGCLGASYSRFYAKGLAALVAMRGREIFQKTKDLIQSHNYEVIYGDTDSFMINVKLSDYEQVMAVGRTLTKGVNKLFKKIKIDIDKVFKCLLLIKKKQYAGLTITRLSNDELEYKKEIKGLEIIKRDCCTVASDTGHKVLEEILKDQPSDMRLKNIFEILETTSRELREGNLPFSSLEITKTLSKDPDKYPNKNHPHVMVAERLNKINARQYKAGDVISYIICVDNTARKPLERAYHVEEFKNNGKMKIDVTYYLKYHVLPIIVKICDPIEGIDDVLIAQSLGIADFYKPKQINEDREGEVPSSLRGNRHKNCVPLKFNCRDCKTENEIKTSVIYTIQDGGCRPSLAMCSNSKCDTPPWKYPYLIQNKLQLAIRQCVSEYYTGETECSNPLCCNSTRSIYLDSDDGLMQCYDCFDGRRYRKYSEIDLHNQLTFFVNIFTLDQAACQNLDLFTLQEIMDFYTGLREFMLDQIDSNAYSIVDLNRLFTPNLESRKDDDLGSELT